MGKLFTLKVDRNSKEGLQVTLEVSEAGQAADVSAIALLPDPETLVKNYEEWQVAYRSVTNPGHSKIKRREAQTQQVSVLDCQTSGEKLKQALNQWLASNSFLPVRERWLQEFQPETDFRVHLQIIDSDPNTALQLHRLPWYLWDLVEDNYPLEIALSPPEYDLPPRPKVPTLREKVRILAIVGDGTGLDLDKDLATLQATDAEIKILTEPRRYEINDELWERTWDILFFTGHSNTEGDTGKIYLNQGTEEREQEFLTIPDLKYSLQKAIANGLQIALFNSCDGLGLAYQLGQLNIPHVIVMREQIKDLIAQKFLRYFLNHFTQGYPLHLAVREARQQLQGHETLFPCASWLPVLCQSATAIPPSWQDLGRRPTQVIPYKGLAAFTTDDAIFFHGRETFTGKLVTAIHKQSLVAVVGASGSGKSSVAFAGLVPRLKQEIPQAKITSFRPGQYPFEALVMTLLTLQHPTHSRIEVMEWGMRLQSQETVLPQLVNPIINESEETRLILIIDQFEELFTLCRDPQQQEIFLARLLQVQEIPGLQAILTLRADFYKAAIVYPPFAEALETACFNLAPMTDEELESAIAQPAQTLNITLEPGLTQRLIQDARQQQHATDPELPLLEFALTQLWSQLQAGKLTHSAYEQIGGVQSAITRHAEGIYGQLTPKQQEQARQVLIQLVQPGNDTPDTRRRATRNDLGENWELVPILANGRLVVTDYQEATETETVEIIHEALLQNWQRLADWMQTDREFRRWQEQLRSAMIRWEQSGKDPDALLRGKLLNEAESWLQEREAELFNEKTYIQLSLEERDRAYQAELERLRREKRNAQRVTVGAITAFIIILASGGFAWQQRQAMLQIFRDFAVGLRQPTPTLLQTLPNFLREAQQREQQGDIDRAIAYYRQLLTATSELNTRMQANPEEFPQQETTQDTLTTYTEQANTALLNLVKTHRLPQLETELQQQQYGEIIDQPKALENRFTPGALRTTYALIMQEFGFHADQNNDSILDPIEAETVPCEIWQAVEKLWRNATDNRCGWYGVDSDFENLNCTELVVTGEEEIFNPETGETKTLPTQAGGTLLFTLIPFPHDAAIERINHCQAVTLSLGE